SLEAPEGVDFAKATRIAAAVAHGRDLVNLPANALTPSALEAEAVELAERFGAEVRIVMGEDLAAGFPLIAAVGAAAAEAPRLVDFTWGRADGDAGRQGRGFRHRRHRHQARQRHGVDEKGYGRRRDGADARPSGHGGSPRRQAARTAADRRERHFRAGDAAR